MTASPQALARQQQHHEELCAAAIRALSGERELHFRGQRLHRRGGALPAWAPHLTTRLPADDFSSFRGAADGLALRLRDSDAVLHATLAPADAIGRSLFSLLEQFRVESRVPQGMPGVVHNLRHRFEAWSRQFQASGLADTSRGILLFTVVQMVRARVLAQAVIEAADGPIEATRAGLSPIIGHLLATMRRSRHEQAVYAVHALALVDLVRDAIASSEEARGTSADARESDPFTLFLVQEDDETDNVLVAHSAASRVFAEAANRYRVFSTAYDLELRPAAHTREAQLNEWRDRLDARIAELRLPTRKLARELKAVLAQPLREGWNDMQDEGQIDGRRLAMLVTSPSERRLFRQPRVTPKASCALTLLIDCSGSMKQHMETLAPLVDVWARALELADITTEVLGFSTGAWNGGRARRDWFRAGKPAHPGRLNEVHHLIFKDARTSWRHARRGIAAMMKSEQFREGIDGEAVDWACGRLNACEVDGGIDGHPPRRILMVISDGCPMDGATAMANDPHYLDAHLRHVVARHERGSHVQIFGIGVGLDLSPFYARCRAIDLAHMPGGRVLGEWVGMLAEQRRAGSMFKLLETQLERPWT